jgi:hypothetical protein
MSSCSQITRQPQRRTITTLSISGLANRPPPFHDAGMFRVLTCFIALSSASAQWTTSRIHGSPEPPKPFVPEQAFTQIALNDALEMIAVPGANRFVAVEKGGKIWSFKDSPGAEYERPAHRFEAGSPAAELRLRHRVSSEVEGERLCLSSPTLTAASVEDGTKLSRFKLTQQEPPVLDPKSETVLLTWRSGGHNGASLQLAPTACSTSPRAMPRCPRRRIRSTRGRTSATCFPPSCASTWIMRKTAKRMPSRRTIRF